MKLEILFLIICFIFSCHSDQLPSTKQDYIIRHVKIYASHDEYYAWPSIARAANGDLLVAFCLTEEHLGPNGRIVMMRSKNNGKDWDGPTVIYDSIIDDRESGLTTLRNGSIVAHYWSTQFTKGKYENLPPKAYPPATINRWIEYIRQPKYKNAIDVQGGWISTSSDNGYTWSKPVRGPDSIHGGIQLADGSLFIASYREHKGNIGVYATQAPDKSGNKSQHSYVRRLIVSALESHMFCNSPRAELL